MARKRPKIFQSEANMKKAMNNLGDNLVSNALDSTAKSLASNLPEGMEIKRKPKYLELTENRLNSLGVIDLKPYFARSSKRKNRKGGGWYLTVPIRRRARGMSRRMYEQLRAIDIAPSQRKTVISDYMYDNRKTSDATMLNYTPRSKNITKIRSGTNRHDYIAFRTVSDKSPANSWIINRDRVTVSNTSKTFVANVNRLMKYNMKNQ